MAFWQQNTDRNSWKMQLMHNLNSNPYFLDICFFLNASFSFFLQGNLTLRCNEQILKLTSCSNGIMHPGKSSENGLFPAQFYSFTKICNLKV